MISDVTALEHARDSFIASNRTGTVWCLLCKSIIHHLSPYGNSVRMKKSLWFSQCILCCSVSRDLLQKRANIEYNFTLTIIWFKGLSQKIESEAFTPINLVWLSLFIWEMETLSCAARLTESVLIFSSYLSWYKFSLAKSTFRKPVKETEYWAKWSIFLRQGKQYFPLSREALKTGVWHGERSLIDGHVLQSLNYIKNAYIEKGKKVLSPCDSVMKTRLKTS